MLGAEALRDAHVDAITMADNSLAVTRMSNLALGSLIKDKLGIRPLIHIACRDRNLIGTQSHLMGLDALSIDISHSAKQIYCAPPAAGAGVAAGIGVPSVAWIN